MSFRPPALALSAADTDDSACPRPGSGRIEVATQVGDNTAPHGPTLDYDLA